METNYKWQGRRGLAAFHFVVDMQLFQLWDQFNDFLNVTEIAGHLYFLTFALFREKK